jgi:hypothetical protein
MSEHGGMPENWRSLGVSILFGIFAFAFGFEAVVNLNSGLLGEGAAYYFVAVADAVMCLFLAAIALLILRGRAVLPAALFSSAQRISQNAYIWVGSIIAIFIVLALPHLLSQISALVVASKSPTAAEIAALIPKPPTAEEIARALVLLLPKANGTAPSLSASDLTRAIQPLQSQLAEVKVSLDKLRQGPPTTVSGQFYSCPEKGKFADDIDTLETAIANYQTEVRASLTGSIFPAPGSRPWGIRGPQVSLSERPAREMEIA